ESEGELRRRAQRSDERRLQSLRVGKQHADRGADALLARHAGFPTEAVGESLDDRQSDAVAASATLIAAEKRHESARELLLVHADAGIAYDDAIEFDADRHASALGVLARVADQVANEHAERTRRRVEDELAACLAHDMHGLAFAQRLRALDF